MPPDPPHPTVPFTLAPLALLVAAAALAVALHRDPQAAAWAALGTAMAHSALRIGRRTADDRKAPHDAA
jgi:hypothetical protein